MKCQAAEPQVITASHDSTIKLWDLAAGKCRATLTNHKKSVRGLVLHPKLLVTSTLLLATKLIERGYYCTHWGF